MSFRRSNSVISPVLTGHRLNTGLLFCGLCLPNWMAGAKWFDLCNRNYGTLTSMTNSTNGFRDPRSRPGGLGSLLFDGSAGYVALNLSSLGTLTKGSMALWVNLQSSAGAVIFEGTTSSSPSFEKGTATQIMFYLNNTNFCAINSIATNVWYHIVGTWDATNFRAYNNGLLQNSAANIASVTFGATAHLGSRNGSVGVNCLTDDLRIWSRPLSAIEILDLYNDSRGGYQDTLYRSSRRMGRVGARGGLLLSRRRKAVCA